MSPLQSKSDSLCVLFRTATGTLARGFLSLASERPELEAAVCGSELPEFLEKAEQLRPHVVLLDTSSHVDFASITELRKRCPASFVVLWVDTISVEVAHQAKAAGVRGILRKDVREEVLLRCLTTVATGELWFERSLMNSLLQVREVRLSPRERQLLSLVALGLSNKQLAAELMISEGTIKVYLAKLFRKVDVHDRYELAMHGLRMLGFVGVQAGDPTHRCFPSSIVLGASPQSFGFYESSDRTRTQ